EVFIVTGSALNDRDQGLSDLKDQDHADQANGRQVDIDRTQFPSADALSHRLARERVVGQKRGGHLLEVRAAGQQFAMQYASEIRVAEDVGCVRPYELR